MAVNEAKLNEFLGKVVGDIGAAMSAALVVVGDRLGLYKALAKGGPMTSADLANETETGERYVREWLLNQAAGGYVEYSPKTGKYSMTEEQAAALADEESPAFVCGAFDVVGACHRDEPKVTKVFKNGGGIPWGDHDACLFCGTERFFAGSYRGNLSQAWIPALDGVQKKLEVGCDVADVGCGHGASTIIMAKAFPKSRFVGFDAHKPSIECARKRAKDAGVADRVTFDVANSTDFPGPAGKGGAWDLVCCFDCLHDMGDPEGCARHVCTSLKKDGTWMVVEPAAADKIEDNFNPIGRTHSAASTQICVPASLASNGPALGAVAGPKRLSEVITRGGFKKCRVAARTPFNMILEARP